MKRLLQITLLTFAAVAAMGALAQEPGTPPWLASDPDHAALKAGMISVTVPLYEGDLPRAVAVADSFLAGHPGHPLPLMMKARVLREGILEQDWNTDLIKEQSVPVHALLDEAVNLCDAAMEAGTDGPADLFYRGWARMFKSQLHAVAVSNYSAGRAAASGHGDLEKYLEMEPSDPDARGFMGIYQYYAATLPAIAKFFSKLLFIPGGNEAMGLANMRYACAKNSPLLTDHQVVRASTFVFFAGRLEEAVPVFREVLSRHPRYLRMAEPLAVTSLFYPAERNSLRRLQDGILKRHVSKQETAADWKTLRRISFYESLAALLYESPDAAMDGFSQVADKKMARPDWMDSFARLNLACLLSCSGQQTRARALFLELTAEPVQEEIRSAAKTCLEDVHSWNSRDLEADFAFVQAIHDGRWPVAREGLAEYRLMRGENLVYHFYSGELALVEGDPNRAEAHFHEALEIEAPLTQRVFRMFTAVRLAEIEGIRGHFKSAAALIDQALDDRLNEPLLKLVLKGRKRFYEKLESDRIVIAPGLVAIPRKSG